MPAFFGIQKCGSVTAIFAMSLLLCCQPGRAMADGPGAESLKSGLESAEFYDKASPGALPIHVLKIDPQKCRFKLLSASEREGGPRSLKGWSEEFGLDAVINASMYQEENLDRSTGFMKNFNHLNNPTINSRYGAFIVFNPVDPLLPPVQFIDKRLQPDWRQRIEEYHTVIQNYRMISAGEQTGWYRDQKAHSTAALGMDGGGNVLFIFSSMPRTTNDFIDLLLKLPLEIRDAMYLEGGAYAGLYRRDAGSARVTGAGFDRLHSLKVPNVIGVVCRK
jgi:hypothetical protein